MCNMDGACHNDYEKDDGHQHYLDINGRCMLCNEIIESLCEKCLDRKDCHKHNDKGYNCYNTDECDDLVRYAVQCSNKKGKKIIFYYKNFEDLPEKIQKQWKSREVDHEKNDSKFVCPLCGTENEVNLDINNQFVCKHCNCKTTPEKVIK